MDSNAVLGITGLLATIVFGAASIYLVVRRRYPGRLSFLVDREIKLFQDIVRRVPEISVLYSGTPVAENLVLLRAFLVNTGDRDIAPFMVHKKLHAMLPDGFVWRTAKTTDQPVDVSAVFEITQPNALAIDVGLLRRNEFIALEAVVEVPSSSSVEQRRAIQKALRLEHRIADTAPVKVEPVPGPLSSRPKRFAILFAVYVLGVLATPFILHYLVKPGQFCYTGKLPNGHRVVYRARPYSDGTLDLIDLRGRQKKTISLEQFESMHLQRTIGPLDLWAPFGYMAAILAVLAILLYSLMAIQWRRSRRLRRILERSEELRPSSTAVSPGTGPQEKG